MTKKDYIFGNVMPKNASKKSLKKQKKYIKKYGDDRTKTYYLAPVKNPTLYNDFNLYDLVLQDKPFDFSKITNPLVIGNIRMGFGHYRISMAIASAAHALGYTPLWFDLNSFSETATTKIISSNNSLYSLGSKLSQKSRLFNKFVWDPMNTEGFKKLTYNLSDQRMTEIFSGLYSSLPKDVPFISTHAWAAQGAIHAGFTNVVDAICDNWPMALHLSEGSIHTVQGPYAFLGYKRLKGMQKTEAKPMPKDTLKLVGHYIDDEFIKNLEVDTKSRLNRLNNDKPKRFLLSIGGAGAQEDLFYSIITYLKKDILNKKATLFLNFGDHIDVYNKLLSRISWLKDATTYFDDFSKTREFEATALASDEIYGVHIFWHKSIFEAVYSTNLLIRVSDLLITKPSELAYYPIPKLFIKHVGGHEVYGAIRSQELGDGTTECTDIKETISMLKLILNDNEILEYMCNSIINNNKAHIYDGAYNAVKLTK